MSKLFVSAAAEAASSGDLVQTGESLVSNFKNGDATGVMADLASLSAILAPRIPGTQYLISGIKRTQALR